jgi:5-methylcytosine-specific restriction protein A
MPVKPCNGKHNNCPNTVKIGQKYCPNCAPKEKQKERAITAEYDKERGSAAQRGYDSHWQKVRLRKLKKDPLCDKHMPYIVAATLVHHIDGNSKNNAADNLMSLCNRCHEDIHKGDRFGRKSRH